MSEILPGIEVSPSSAERWLSPAVGSAVPAKLPVAVIGAGFSGTIAALQLLRRVPADQPVLLCERSSDFARGLAYATGESDHLLNVRAANMSALADEPAHFEQWLSAQPGAPLEGLRNTDAGVFASRGIYGQYLRALLTAAMRDTAGHAQLRLMPDDVTTVTVHGADRFTLDFAGGGKIDVGGIVLAAGNLVPEENPDPCICANPWSEKATRPLASSEPVLLIGTGLTMVDVAISLRRRGFTGRIVALSRGGLLPIRHAAAGSWPAPRLTDTDHQSIRLLLRRLRREIRVAAEQGINWRAVIDSLRPFTAALWGRMPSGERDRFLRHVRRYWDVHRHRIAPPLADQIDRMLGDGSLQILSGRVARLEPLGGSVNVHYRLRGGAAEQSLNVQRVIMANGLAPIARTRDPLMNSLLANGIARLDKHGLGLDVTETLKIISADGGASSRIWALGPIVRGVFWECVAVPDIRVQATQMAASVTAELAADTPSWNFVI